MIQATTDDAPKSGAITPAKMDAALKAKWVEALRSGEYPQTTHYLKDHRGYCCLGVLCEIQGADFEAIEQRYGSLSLSQSPPEYIGMLGPKSSALSMMNDDGDNFETIANFIEANL